MQTKRPRLSVLGAIALAGALSLGTASVIAKPAVFGPSIVPAGKAVVFQGSGFKPNEALTVALRQPEGTEAHFATVADAKGGLQYKLAAKMRGTYSLRVLDSSGRALSETRFVSP